MASAVLPPPLSSRRQPCKCFAASKPFFPTMVVANFQYWCDGSCFWLICDHRIAPRCRLVFLHKQTDCTEPHPLGVKKFQPMGIWFGRILPYFTTAKRAKIKFRPCRGGARFQGFCSAPYSFVCSPIIQQHTRTRVCEHTLAYTHIYNSHTYTHTEHITHTKQKHT